MSTPRRLMFVLINSKNMFNAHVNVSDINTTMHQHAYIDLAFPYKHALVVYSDKNNKNVNTQVTLSPSMLKYVNGSIYLMLYDIYKNECVDMDKELFMNIYAYMKYIKK
jgi:hypothetical protein